MFKFIVVFLNKKTGDHVSTFEVKNSKVLQVEPQALTLLAEQAMVDVAHLLRPAHLQVDFSSFSSD
jgi:fumarate hydratase class I